MKTPWERYIEAVHQFEGAMPGTTLAAASQRRLENLELNWFRIRPTVLYRRALRNGPEPVQ